jgi:hypothetical protein
MNLKKSLLVLTSLLLLGATNANAQLKFGIRAGMDVEKASFDSKVLDKDNRLGFQVGPMVQLALPLTGLNLEAGALYHNYKVKATVEDVTESSTLQYIDVPISANYVIGLGSFLSVYGQTGPQFSFNVGDGDILGKSYSLKSSSFSWNIGCGVKLISKLQIGYNYNIACGRTADAKATGILWDIATDAITKDVKHNTHQLNVTNFF